MSYNLERVQIAESTPKLRNQGSSTSIPVQFFFQVSLVGGWVLPRKMMEFVSWDYDITNWMEK